MLIFIELFIFDIYLYILDKLIIYWFIDFRREETNGSSGEFQGVPKTSEDFQKALRRSHRKDSRASAWLSNLIEMSDSNEVNSYIL